MCTYYFYFFATIQIPIIHPTEQGVIDKSRDGTF